MQFSKTGTIDIPVELIDKWQETVDLLANILEIPSALITKATSEYREILVSSNSINNPYHSGDKEIWDNLFCKTVYASKQKLLIPNAASETKWSNCADCTRHGMIAYLGYPVFFPNNQLLGTLCILDTKEHHFSNNQELLLLKLKNSIELELAYHMQRIELSVTQKLLHENELKMQMVFDTMSDGLIIIDSNGSFSECNRAALSAFQLTKTQLLGQTATDPRWKSCHIDGTDFPYEEQPGIMALRTGKKVSDVIGLDLPSGERRWINVTATPFECSNKAAGDGALIRNVLVTFSNITELKMADMQILEARNRFELAAASAELGIWDWDIVNNTMVWDDQMYRLYGTSSASPYTGIDLWKNGLHPDDFEYAWSECQAAMRGEKKYNVEFRIRHPDGTVRFIKADGIVLRDNAGNAIRMLGVNRDITENKRSEEALKKSEALLRTAIENLPLIFYMVDKSGIFRLSVGAGLKGLGLEQNQVVGMSAFEIYKDHDEIVTSLQKAIDGTTTTFETTVGSASYFNVCVPFTPRNGEFTGIVAVALEITERQRAQEMLKNMQKLESLGVLAGGIAHDFNNLMGGIFGYIDMALDSCKDPEISHYLTKTVNTIDRARALTQQLLTFAKGGAPIQKIGPLFPFVQETALFALSGSNVSCQFDIASDLKNCNFDKNQIGQVIDNLIINAQQAMPNGGTIVVSAHNVSFTEKEHPLLTKGDYVQIRVKDTGIGIPKELLSKIFDPFFTTKAKGHGLGLATSYSIVYRHAGCIDVQSVPGKGSTFTIYLPVATESAATVMVNTTAVHKGQGIFIIMDDEIVMLETISAMLDSMGYETVCKENGRDAVDFFAAETLAHRKVGGMIFDLTIPGEMGGKEAVEKIRELDSTVPVFVASGYADDPIMKNPQNYGFTASICKPFRKSDLVEILNKYIIHNE